MQNQAMQMHREQSVRKGSVNHTAHFSSVLCEMSFHQKKILLGESDHIPSSELKRKYFPL